MRIDPRVLPPRCCCAPSAISRRSRRIRIAFFTAESSTLKRNKSSAIDSAIPGLWTFMATSEPSRRRPRYTCPRLAAATEVWEISAKRLEIGAPSSVLMRRIARASLKGGMRSCGSEREESDRRWARGATAG